MLRDKEQKRADKRKHSFFAGGLRRAIKTKKVKIFLTFFTPPLGSWREFGCRDDANAWRKSTKEADKHKIFFLQFRK